MGASAIATFTITGPADPARVRLAGMLDWLGAAFVTMLVLPQPFIRAAIMGQAASAGSIAAFVGVMVGGIVVVLALYLSFSAVTWGRTPVMYLFDLGLEAPTKPTTGEALAWAAGWTLAGIPALLGVRVAYDPETGWPARLSGVPTRSTAPSGSTPAQKTRDDEGA